MCSIRYDLEMIYEAILAVFTYIWGGINSPLGIAAVGSFFGAVGGYCIVLVTNRRSEILSKIDHLKIAIALTHSIFNLAYGLNKQQIYNLYQQYADGKTKFIEGKAKGTPVEVLFNTSTISPPYIDFELINSKLLRETGFTGRAFLLADTLIRCLHALKEQLEYRHTVLNEINSMSLGTHDKACLYYGIQIETPTGGFFYEKYSDVMKAIKIFTVDCEWFSKELALELIENAKKESKKIFLRRPKIGSVDYSDVDPKYMPNDADYKAWREKFIKAR